MNQQAKYKLIGFVMMFASSSLMGGIGAFTRFIDAPGDFVSFWRNFAGLIALSLIFCFVGGSWKKIKETRFSGMMLLSGVFLACSLACTACLRSTPRWRTHRSSSTPAPSTQPSWQRSS